MKEAIGGTYLFQITILFLLIFTGVMCITINRSKAFGVKDEVINIIQTHKFAGSSNLVDGEEINLDLDEETIEDIIEYINSSGYRITSDCDLVDRNNPGSYQGYTRDGNKTNGSDATICVRTVNVSESYYDDLGKKCNGTCDYIDGDMPNMIYYDIALFYQIDAPILDDVFNFTLKGSTKIMYS